MQLKLKWNQTMRLNKKSWFKASIWLVALKIKARWLKFIFRSSCHFLQDFISDQPDESVFILCRDNRWRGSGGSARWGTTCRTSGSWTTSPPSASAASAEDLGRAARVRQTGARSPERSWSSADVEPSLRPAWLRWRQRRRWRCGARRRGDPWRCRRRSVAAAGGGWARRRGRPSRRRSSGEPHARRWSQPGTRRPVHEKYNILLSRSTATSLLNIYSYCWSTAVTSGCKVGFGSQIKYFWLALNCKNLHFEQLTS